MTCIRVQKKTFNPETNYFTFEDVILERELTLYEEELWEKRDKNESRGFWSIGLGILIGLICFITFGILMSFSNWFAIGVIFGIICFVGGFILAHAYFWKKEQSYAEELRAFRQEFKEDLWADVEAMVEVNTYNENQEKIAEVWRAAHPFEEYIRTCINDPDSSVAIANAAKYYAESYFAKED